MKGISKRFALLWNELPDPEPEPEPTSGVETFEILQSNTETVFANEVDELGHLIVSGNIEVSGSELSFSEDVVSWNAGDTGVSAPAGDFYLQSEGGILMQADGDISINGPRVRIQNAEMVFQLPCPQNIRDGTFVTVDTHGYAVPISQLWSNPVLGMVIGRENDRVILMTSGLVQTEDPMDVVPGYRVCLSRTTGLLSARRENVYTEDHIEIGVALSTNSLLLRVR